MFLKKPLRLSLFLSVVGSIGCGDGEAPRHPVHGVITLNGEAYPDALVKYVPEPGNAALAEGEDVTGPNGNYKITNLGRAGLPVGKYKVLVTPKQSAEEAAAEQAKFEDEEQRRMAMASLGVDPAKQAKKAGKPTGEFEAEVVAGDNSLEFDVKAKSSK